MTKREKEAVEALKAAMKRYDITVDELGPKYQKLVREYDRKKEQ